MLTPDRLPEGDDWVFFAVTPADYETLSLNQSETLRWAHEAMWRLVYYAGEQPNE